MLDERWSADSEEIGQALRRMLAEESSIAKVRAAEAREDGRLPEFEAQLDAFGLRDLPADPGIAARVAYELGRALAPCAYIETMPALLVLGVANVAYGFEGDVPAALPKVAVRTQTGVSIYALAGAKARSAAGDWLVRPELPAKAETSGGPDEADRMWRLMRLVDSARLIGAGQAALGVGVAYAKERVAGGRVIGAYQAVSHKLANAAIALEGAELLLRKAAFTATAGAGGDGAPTLPFAVFLRAKAVNAARLAVTTAHQVMGGYGFTLDFDCQLYSRRIRNWTGRLTPPGPDLARVARMLLTASERDRVRWLWQHEQGLDIPRWARASDATSSGEARGV